MEIDNKQKLSNGKGVEIHAGFDGATPYSIEGIKLTGDCEFTIYPSHRITEGEGEESKGKSARMTTEIVNKSSIAVPVRIKIDHEDSDGKFRDYRDTYYKKHENDLEWEMISTPVVNGVSIYCGYFNPGSTLIAQSPTYNYTQNEEFVKSISKLDNVDTVIYGESEKNLNLWLIKICDDRHIHSEKKKVGVVARNHAYETVGNYCIEGMVEFLNSHDEIAKYFLSKYDFYFLPMTNPDGVKFGMSRLTSPKGADLNRCMTRDDSSLRAFKKILDKEKFDLFVNIHNWQEKFCDGILCMDRSFGELFQTFTSSLRQYSKIQKIESHQEWLKTHNVDSVAKIKHNWKTWKNYVTELKDDVNAMTLEFSWYGRKPKDFRLIGKTVLTAAVHADMHTRIKNKAFLK